LALESTTSFEHAVLGHVLEHLAEGHDVPGVVLAGRGARVVHHPEVHHRAHLAAAKDVAHLLAPQVELVMHHVARAVGEGPSVDAHHAKTSVQQAAHGLAEAAHDARHHDAAVVLRGAVAHGGGASGRTRGGVKRG
jgi:hypothetical protein